MPLMWRFDRATQILLDRFRDHVVDALCLSAQSRLVAYGSLSNSSSVTGQTSGTGSGAAPSIVSGRPRTASV
jgi:hypothetical protein